LVLKDAGVDANYSPSPNSVLLTTGSGTQGYTTLTPANLEATTASIHASNLLPYLTGSAPLLAYGYPNQTLAYTHVEGWWLFAMLLLVLLLGYAAAFFVPSLPLGMPRRDFGILSLLTLESGDELPMPVKKSGSAWAKDADLGDLKRRLEGVKVRYGA